MAVVARDRDNVKTGFADLYYADADTAIPDDTTVDRGTDPGVDWTGFGFTEEGVETEFTKSTSEIEVEESDTPIDEVLDRGTLIIRLTLAEDVLANHVLGYGIGSLATTAAGAGQVGKSTFTLGSIIATKALFLEADNTFAAAEGWRRIYIPRVKSVGAVGTAYRRNAKRLIPIEFKAVCALSDIIIEEKTADATA